MLVTKSEFPILTNFRFSLDLSKSDKIEFCKRVYTKYMPGYIYWPPEIHLLSYILTNKMSSLSLSNVETVVRDFQKANNLTNGVDKLVSYFFKYVNLDLNHIISDMLRFSGTWDQYALGMCYLKLIEDLQKNIKTSNKFVVMFLDLLRETVDTMPSSRPIVSTTQVKFKQLVDDTDIADFLSLF